jgi:hypothetical protein
MVKNTKGGSSHKKMARKNESDNKIIKVNLNINFKKENMLVFIERNLGNCFLGRQLHYAGTNNEFDGKDLKIMHQRGKKGKSNFDHSQSKIALISLITDISLSSKCIGVVEDFIEIDHLNAYLTNNLISQEVYSKLNMKLSTATESKDNEEENVGFEFDRSKQTNKTIYDNTNFHGINESTDDDEEDNAEDVAVNTSDEDTSDEDTSDEDTSEDSKQVNTKQVNTKQVNTKQVNTKQVKPKLVNKKINNLTEEDNKEKDLNIEEI